LVKINETHDWNENIQNKVDAIYGIYLYDENQHTNLAELTPSYYLEPMYCSVYTQDDNASIDLNDEDSPEKQQFVEDVEQEWKRLTEPKYMHVSDIDMISSENKFEFGLRGTWQEYLDFAYGDKKEAYEQAMEDAIEYLNGNRMLD
jgi:hypothetical protein